MTHSMLVKRHDIVYFDDKGNFCSQERWSIVNKRTEIMGFLSPKEANNFLKNFL